LGDFIFEFRFRSSIIPTELSIIEGLMRDSILSFYPKDKVLIVSQQIDLKLDLILGFRLKLI